MTGMRIIGPESRADGDNGDHSFHTSCFLYGGTPFSAIVFGVLKGVVQLNDSEQVSESFSCLSHKSGC
jgi:hypothetical protein